MWKDSVTDVQFTRHTVRFMATSITQTLRIENDSPPGETVIFADAITVGRYVPVALLLEAVLARGMMGGCQPQLVADFFLSASHHSPTQVHSARIQPEL